MLKKTKIVCTLGPSVDDPKVLSRLCTSGMDVARFNFSHSTHEQHLELLQKVIQARQELDMPVATMLDTKGPELRLGQIEGCVMLNEGETFTLVQDDKEILYATPNQTNSGLLVTFDGTMYSVGRNEYSELGIGRIGNVHTIRKITRKEIISSENIVNFANIGETKQLNYESKLKYNLLTDDLPIGNYSLSTDDSNIASINQNGLVTAKGSGTTYANIVDTVNDTDLSVMISVEGKEESC